MIGDISFAGCKCCGKDCDPSTVGLATTYACGVWQQAVAFMTITRPVDQEAGACAPLFNRSSTSGSFALRHRGSDDGVQIFARRPGEHDADGLTIYAELQEMEPVAAPGSWSLTLCEISIDDVVVYRYVRGPDVAGPLGPKLQAEARSTCACLTITGGLRAILRRWKADDLPSSFSLSGSGAEGPMSEQCGLVELLAQGCADKLNHTWTWAAADLSFFGHPDDVAAGTPLDGYFYRVFAEAAIIERPCAVPGASPAGVTAQMSLTGGVFAPLSTLVRCSGDVACLPMAQVVIETSPGPASPPGTGGPCDGGGECQYTTIDCMSCQGMAPVDIDSRLSLTWSHVPTRPFVGCADDVWTTAWLSHFYGYTETPVGSGREYLCTAAFHLVEG